MKTVNYFIILGISIGISSCLNTTERKKVVDEYATVPEDHDIEYTTAENADNEILEIVLAEKSMIEAENFNLEIIPISELDEDVNKVKLNEDDPAREIKNQLGAIRKACSESTDKPTKISDLTGGYDLFFSSFEEDIAASLNLIPFGSISGNDRSIVVVYNFLQYKKDYCSVDSKDYPVLWGSGIQMILHIKSRKSSMKTTTMAGLAAAVDYNRAQVEYRLTTIGIIGDPVRFRVATQGEFSVDNYAKIISNVDEIIKLMSDKDVTVTPQLVAVEKQL